jgi:hypothetical protein
MPPAASRAAFESSARDRTRDLGAADRPARAPSDHAVGAHQRRPAGREAIALGERLGIDDVRRRPGRRPIVDAIARGAQHDEL